MQKFAASIKQTMQHIEGEVRLDVPDMDWPSDDSPGGITDMDWPSDDPDVNVKNDLLRQKVRPTIESRLNKLMAGLIIILPPRCHDDHSRGRS